jgi:rare lipoprotein A
MTAAHRTLPFGTFVRVTLGERSVVVKINDRGPWKRGRDIDLGLGAARRLGCSGLCHVTLEVVEAPYVPHTRSAWGNQ